MKGVAEAGSAILAGGGLFDRGGERFAPITHRDGPPRGSASLPHLSAQRKGKASAGGAPLFCTCLPGQGAVPKRQQEKHNMQHATNITAHMETVTPERAAKLLEGNTRNRPLSKGYVRELRRELEEGRWRATHQGVALAADGTVLDGQHRLYAIVESGIAAELLIAEGVDEDAFGAIDQHRKRTGGQMLQMSGVLKEAPRLIAMARAILQVVHGTTKITNAAATEYVMAHRGELERFLPVARKFTPAVGGAFAWCAVLGWQDLDAAAERLVDNGPWEEPQETDPMRALANRSREFVKLGPGGAGIKARFDIALNCLQAAHEGRGLRVARSYRPDYAALEADSLAPRESTAIAHEVSVPKHRPLPDFSSVREPQDPTRQARIEYEGAPDASYESLSPPAAEVEIDDAHAAKLDATMANVRRRKSFLSPADILSKASKAE